MMTLISLMSAPVVVYAVGWLAMFVVGFFGARLPPSWRRERIMTAIGLANVWPVIAAMIVILFVDQVWRVMRGRRE